MARLTKRERELLKAIKKAYIEDSLEITFKIEQIADIDPLVDFEEYDGDNTKTAKFMIDEVKKLIEAKDKKAKELENALLLPELPQELQRILDGIGDTPEKEPEVANAKEDDKIIKIIKDRFDIDLNQYNLYVRDLFIAKAVNKVNSLINDDGFVKHTELTKKFGFLTSKERKEIIKLLQKETVDDEDINLEELEKKQNDLEKKVIKIISKNRKELFNKATEWEKRLMAEEAIIQIINPEKSYNMGF